MPQMGERIAQYRLISQLGAGGMGIVYRAEDERLGREVAVKVLPPDALVDETLRQRFRLEARTLCRLNHPNIASLYDFGEEDGVDYLVMELIAGRTLREMLAGGALPISQVVSLGVQIARGLAAGHEIGVIHRDVKANNVIVTREGHVKIVDFGLAKQIHAAMPDIAEFTTATTGAVAGTVPYMAPEQLRGDALDARLDIYGAGVVLYELATGRLPFTEHGAMLVDAILNRTPAPPSSLHSGIPAALDFIVLKALEKNPADRYQTARDLITDLERPTMKQTPGLPRPAARRRHWRAAAGVAAAAAALVAGVWFGTTRRKAPVQAKLEQLTEFTDAALAPSVSPDGRMLAYVRSGTGAIGNSAQRHAQLYVQFLPNGEPQRLTNDDRPKNWPMFSPDGSRIAFTSTDVRFVWDTWQVPVLGGEPAPLLRNASGLSWIADGEVLYSKIVDGLHMGIATAHESRTGERMIYLPVGASSMAHRSFISPDRKWLLAVEMDTNGIWQPCRLLPFDGSSAGRPVGPGNSQCTSAAWSPEQRWMYFSANASGAFHLWRQRFPDGEPEQVTFGPTEEEGTSVAPDGKWLATSAGTQVSTVWLHDAGGEHQLTSQGYALWPTLAPDRQSVYYVVRGAGAATYGAGELWRVDAGGLHSERVLPGVVMSGYQISRDGRKALFTTAGDSGVGGIWIAELERRSSPRQLTNGGEYRAFFGASGEVIFMSSTEPRYLMRMDEDGANCRRVSDKVVFYVFAVSPDGAWAAVSQPVVGHGEATNSISAFSTRDGRAVLLCDVCVAGFGPARIFAPAISFGQDGRWFYFSMQYANERSSNTVALPLKNKQPFDFVTDGQIEEKTLISRFGARIIQEKDVFPGPDPSVYVYTKTSAASNIYRVWLPD